jgi:hypothetical protein
LCEVDFQQVGGTSRKRPVEKYSTLLPYLPAVVVKRTNLLKALRRHENPDCSGEKHAITGNPGSFDDGFRVNPGWMRIVTEHVNRYEMVLGELA